MTYLITIVDKYFVETINDRDFVLGLDPTGVFAFTESSSRSKTIASLKELKEELSLCDDEVVLCYVGNPLGVYQNEVTLDVLGQWVQETTASRPSIFNRADIQDIEDCYKIAGNDDAQVINALREFNLTDGVIYHLMDNKPQNIWEVKELGVVDEVAAEVFEILCSGLYERKNNEVGTVTSSVAVSMVSYLRRRIYSSLIFCLAACAVLVVTRRCIFGFIPAFVAFIIMVMTSHRHSYSVTRYVFAISATLAGLTGIFGLLQIIIKFV